MPTLSRRSSRSTSTTTTLRSPKPPGWSGSLKSTPAKAKNGASAALSYVFAEPEMANMGDGLGAATTLNSSASVGRSMSEGQSTPDGQSSAPTSMPGSPTPARKTTWYGSLSRSKGRKHTQQLVRVDEPQQDTVNNNPRLDVVVQSSMLSPSAEPVLSESPTAIHDERSLAIEQPLPEPLTLMPAAGDDIAPPSTPSPAKRRWFSSTTPGPKSSPVEAAVAPEIPTTTSLPQLTATDIPETTIGLHSASSISLTSNEMPPTAVDPPSPELQIPAPGPRDVETTTVPIPPSQAPVTPKRGWFSSSAASAAPPAASPATVLVPPPAAPATTSSPQPPATPALVLPAPPDVAAVMEKLEVSPSPSSEQAKLAPPPLPPARRSWFSPYTPASTSTASLPTLASAPTTPPQPTHAHSIPSSLDDEVPMLSSLPFPGSAPSLSMNPITPSPSASGLPAPSSPTSSSPPSNSSSTSSGNTVRPEPRPRLSSLSSLNPSTSRFTLSIPLPLLGRAKVPLPVSRKEERTEAVEGAAVFQAGQNVPRVIEPTTTETAITGTTINTTMTTDPAPPPAPVSTPISTSTPSTAVLSSPPTTDQTTDQPTSTEAPTTEAKASTHAENSSIASSTSWWAYVGWSSAPLPSSSSNTDSVADATGAEEARKNPDPPTGPDAEHVNVEESTTVATTTTVPSPATPVQQKEMTKKEKEKPKVKKAMDGGKNPTSKDTKPVEINVTLPAEPQSPTKVASDAAMPTTDLAPNANLKTADAVSMKSQNTASQAWYSPWAWYGSSTATDTVEVGEGEKDAEAKTEAELVKEAALAREEATPPLPAPEPPKEEPKLEEHNPVEKSFETHRSGWAAFFSSRALGMKLIKAPGDVERDENGMEVMELDFEEDDAQSTTSGVPGGGQTASAGTPASKPNAGGVAAPVAPADGGQGKGTDGARGRTGGKKSKGTVIAPPLTISDSVKKDVEKAAAAKKGSPAASVNNVPASSKHVPKKGSQSSVKEGGQAATKKGSTSAPTTRASTPGPGTRTQVPNLVLPTWADTFHMPPRSLVPPPQETTFGKTMKFVSGVLFATEKDKGDGGHGRGTGKGKARASEEEFLHFGKGLPRAWDVVEAKGKGKGKGGSVDLDADVLRGCKRVVVIGIHGWFPGAVVRTVLGEPTGTSAKFVNMTVQALEEFESVHGVKLEKVTRIPLEGEGTISGRVQRLYTNLQANAEWMEDLHNADAIIVATHSQGSIVSTHLLDRLIQDGHIRTKRTNPISSAGSNGPGPLDSFSAAGVEALASVGANAMAASGSNVGMLSRKPQRICCLALCGIHLGPLRYLSSSSLLLPYIQYFESTAAKELFEFQNTESDVSKEYVKALTRIVDQGTKMVYVASLNDQVVPIYSGLFTAVSHPLIFRALYIDGDAYHSSDFLSNLLVLLLRILNSGISDSGLLAHLSEATAGSLNGVGHSTAYEEISTYALAVKYLFLTDDGLDDHPELILEPFNANSEQNDYEIPWSLRDVIADERVAHFFGREISELRDAFREWHPKTTILRDLKRKLQPIQRLPSSFSTTSPSPSKL